MANRLSFNYPKSAFLLEIEMPRGIYQHKPQQGFQKGHKAWNKGTKGVMKVNSGSQKPGDKHFNWKGGKYLNYRGYVYVLSPSHPFRGQRNYVREHRIIIEKYLGRYLKPEEKTHHINGIRNDNRLENLILFKNNSVHMAFEQGGIFKPEEIIFDGRRL